MPNMRKFLEANSTFSKAMQIFGMVAPIIMTIMFAVFMIKDSFPLFGLFFICGPFLLVSAFSAYVFLRGRTVYPNWWNSLTDAQRADIEEDYSKAHQLNDYLILGERYAFIHHIGEPILYSSINDVNFVSVRGGWNMFVALRTGRRMVVLIPTLVDRRAIWEALMSRSSKR